MSKESFMGPDSEQRSEILALRDSLDSNESSERKRAAKRVIALMRAGENVGVLFSSMLRCVKTSDLELKKMVYLYLITYSMQEPEQSIMAVNAFVTDAKDSNPLVRALAIRSMCRMKVESVAENMILPLKQSLSDPDPYVRKTAALAVAKLYDIIPDGVENAKLAQELLKLLGDENPMVVSNAAASLFEINERRATPVFLLDEKTSSPIISAMSQCSPWVQTMLLDSLCKYKPSKPEEATFLIDRFIPFLKHANPSVVVSAFKCIFRFMESDSRQPADIFPLIIPPFISLVSSAEPEIQYVVLRTLSLFIIKYPKALSKEIRVFFCKYNDPSYVKMEKVSIMVSICTPHNVSLVIDELEEYCNTVDVGFVKKAISSLGQIAMRIEIAARRCVDILVKLVSSKAEYAIEESIIVVADILRKFPGHFESVIGTVCTNLENLKDPKAKAAAIWIIGEYNQSIEKVDVLIDSFLDSFVDESPDVQLQLLTALVKVFLAKPDETRDQLQFVLNEATKETMLPDIRNRALIYWKLLSADQNACKKFVVFSKQSVSSPTENLDSKVVDELLKNMGNVSGVLHVVPTDFVKSIKYLPDEEEQKTKWRKVAASGGPVEVQIGWAAQTLLIRATNSGTEELSDFAIALNKNCAGLSIEYPPTFGSSLSYGDSMEISVPLVYSESSLGMLDSSVVQCALKVGNISVMFDAPIDLSMILQTAPSIEIAGFEELWSSYPDEDSFKVQGKIIAEDGAMETHNVHTVKRTEGCAEVCFSVVPGAIFLCRLSQTEEGIEAKLRGNRSYFNVIKASAAALFCQQ